MDLIHIAVLAYARESIRRIELFTELFARVTPRLADFVYGGRF
jgi:hypothetical protein